MTDDDLAKIRWQCRRGSKELDLLLIDYLENQFPIANETEKTRFLDMLSLDDEQLMQVMMSSKLTH